MIVEQFQDSSALCIINIMLSLRVWVGGGGRILILQTHLLFRVQYCSLWGGVGGVGGGGRKEIHKLISFL